MPVWKWYFHVLKVFGLAGLTYGGAWAIITLLGCSSILSLTLGYVLGSFLFASGSFLLVGSELRNTFQGLTRNFRAKYGEVL
jgi:hypothetical protein